MSERIRNPIDEPDEARELERQQQHGQAPRPPDDRPDAPRETPAREQEPQERPPPREPEQPPQREAEPEPEGEPESITRLQKQLNEAKRQRYEAERQARDLREQFEQWQQQLRQAQPPQPGQPDPAAIEAAKAQLRQEQERSQFNRHCDDLFLKGSAEYPDFRAEVTALNNAAGADRNVEFLKDVVTREHGHAVYHHLAQNLDEAARVLALDPLSMRIELNRIERAATAASSNGAAAAAPATSVSRAPAPLRPIGGTSRGQREESTADFIRRRDQEEYEARYGPGRR